jgi:lysophospholipase L1-like esterase
LLLPILTSGGRSLTAADSDPTELAIFSVDHANFQLAPYVWKRTGAGATARAEATMPGAYFRVEFKQSATVGLVVDATINGDCPAPSMPVLEYSIDGGVFRVVQLKPLDKVYTLPLADKLATQSPHRLEVHFRASDLSGRWETTRTHFSFAGLSLDTRAELLPVQGRPRRALCFGDSISEGVGVLGLFTSWQKLEFNNARPTWFPMVAAGVGCEYGLLGSGGFGMTRSHELPPLPKTWDRYDPTTSRLTDGRLLPEPEFVFCALGTNDFDKDITSDYDGWLAAMRKACPNTRLFCVVPPLGYHSAEVQRAVESRNRASDSRVHLIDTPALRTGFRVGQGATPLAYDGVHPSVYGQALLAVLISIEVQKILDGGD